MFRLLNRRWFYHTLCWLLAFATLLFLENGRFPESDIFQASIEVFISLSVPALIIYLHFWSKEKWFAKRAYQAYIISIVLIFAMGMLLLQLDTLDANSPWQDAVNLFFFLITGTGIQYFKRGLVNQYQMQELRAVAMEAELNSLKAQLNPHFLFNTLNNIHGVNLQHPEKGSEMLLELSAVMRYHLYFSRQKIISLEDEVELLNAYIELERLRLGNNCELEVDIDDFDPALKVAPLLLLPLVENAFKHGTHSTKKCRVEVQLVTRGNLIQLQLTNSKIEKAKVSKTGVGLLNIRRRLELIYPKSHKLEIQQTAKEYSVGLSISI
ncbi:MAG: sensor histidine kinase [Lewinella sp.]